MKFIGVEAAGEGIDTRAPRRDAVEGPAGRAARLEVVPAAGRVGQVQETHSISAGLDYPGVGPEHSFYKDSGRADVRRRHRHGGARGLQAAERDGGHHPGAGAVARHRLRREVRADAAEGSGHPARALGARRQGHQHGDCGAGIRAVVANALDRDRHRGAAVVQNFWSVRFWLPHSVQKRTIGPVG